MEIQGKALLWANSVRAVLPMVMGPLPSVRDWMIEGCSFCFACTGPPLSEARCAKKFPLLSPALAGLARFAHLISVEYFGDLLAVMLRMLSGPGLPVRVRLAVLLTASEILKCAAHPHVSALFQICVAACIFGGCTRGVHGIRAVHALSCGLCHAACL